MRQPRAHRAALLLPLTLGAFAWAGSESWPLNTRADYSYDPSDIAVDGGAASLISSVTGTGADGDLTVTGATFTLQTSTTGSRSVGDGAAWPITSAVSAGATSLTLSGYTSGLAVGDELLLLVVQGASSSTSVGTYELTRVSGVSGATVSVAALSQSYDGTTHDVIAQRVPNYEDVTLTSGATLTASAWNGSTGGVVAFRASGTLTVDSSSSIDVSGRGYRGGSAGSTSGGGGGGGESWAGVDGDGGKADTTTAIGSGGSGQPTGNSTLGTGGNGGVGAGGGGGDGTDNSDDGAGGGGGGSYAGGGGGGGGGTGCG
ncbi:hypothetical protein L6R46_24475, partial [Myxococcota bacterium]|nr:hypothetical protein [Myxococcota bacterium]